MLKTSPQNQNIFTGNKPRYTSLLPFYFDEILRSWAARGAPFVSVRETKMSTKKTKQIASWMNFLCFSQLHLIDPELLQLQRRTNHVTLMFFSVI